MRTLSVAATLLGVACSGARAEETVLRANLGSRFGYSDNISLAPPGFEHDERLAELTAGIDFSRTEQRQDTHVSYQAQGVFYGESKDSDEVYNTLNASSRWALALDRVYLDMWALYDQTLVDATNKYSFNKLALTGNRTDVAIVGVSPSVKLTFGESVDGEFRVTGTDVNYKNDTLEDDQERVVGFTIGNTKSRRGGTWAVTYDHEEFDYEASPTILFETFEAELGHWMGETVRVFTIQGLESDYSQVGRPGQSPGLDDYYWYVGVDWRPSDRNEILMSGGERSYGDAIRLSWNYRSSLGGIDLGYVEEPNTFLRERLHTVRTAGELTTIDSLDGPNGNLFYLQKRAGVTFLLERPRSAAALRLFDERRFDIVQATASDVLHETERYSGSEISLRWRMSPIATLSALAQSARRQSTLNVIDDELTSYTVTFERQVGRQGVLSFNLAHERAKPLAVINENPYEENQFIVGLRRGFGTGPTSLAPKRFNGYLNGSKRY